MPGGIAAELEETAGSGEDDCLHLNVTQHRQLVRLLEQPTAALGEGDLPIYLVLDPLQLHLPPSHECTRSSRTNPRRVSLGRSLPSLTVLEMIVAPSGEIGELVISRKEMENPK